MRARSSEGRDDIGDTSELGSMVVRSDVAAPKRARTRLLEALWDFGRCIQLRDVSCAVFLRKTVSDLVRFERALREVAEHQEERQVPRDGKFV